MKWFKSYDQSKFRILNGNNYVKNFPTILEGTDNCEIQKRARKPAFYMEGRPKRTSAIKRIKGGRGGCNYHRNLWKGVIKISINLFSYIFADILYTLPRIDLLRMKNAGTQWTIVSYLKR